MYIKVYYDRRNIVTRLYNHIRPPVLQIPQTTESSSNFTYSPYLCLNLLDSWVTSRHIFVQISELLGYEFLERFRAVPGTDTTRLAGGSRMSR